MEFTSEQAIQEHEYEFPYHYIPEWKPFTQAKDLWWGYEYAAYIEYLVGLFEKVPYASLIDIGCGDGRLLAELAKARCDTALYGTDFSEKALAFARAFAPRPVTYVATMPEDRTFEAFAIIEVFEHIPVAEADAFLERVKRSLAPGAIGILTVPHTNVPLNPKHYRHFTHASLAEALEAHFTVERIEHLNARTLQGRIIQRLLANRFFILNWQPAKNLLYRAYKASSLHARPENATRLLAVLRAPEC